MVSRIESREMAEVMAYAEVPYREYGQQMQAPAVRQMAVVEAGRAALRAATDHIESLQTQLARSTEVAAELLPADELAERAALASYFGSQELAEFAALNRRPEVARGLASSVWNLLSRSYRQWQKGQDGPLKYDTGGQSTWRSDTARLELGSLATLLERYEDVKHRRPHTSEAGFFGRGWGPSRIAFLQEFIRYRIDQQKSRGTEQ